jgi:hypothetical protein
MVCVLVNDDCSPNDFVHDEESYPAFYDFCHSLASVYKSTSMQHSNPFWFLYNNYYYYDSLQNLPSSVLTSSARPFVHRRDNAHPENNAIRVILAHFFQHRTELSRMLDDILFVELSSISLPDCCIRSQSTVIAAHLCEAYGDQVTRAICTPPSLDSCLTDDALVSEHSIVFVFPWLCYPLDELTCMLHCLSCDDILSCIHLQPHILHSLIDNRTHMKSCNGLANALWQCALQLCHGGPRMVVDVAMALLPFLDITDWTDAELICYILCSEFSSVIVDCMTHDLCSAKECKSNWEKVHHSALKKSSLQLPVLFSWNVRKHGPQSKWQHYGKLEHHALSISIFAHVQCADPKHHILTCCGTP